MTISYSKFLPRQKKPDYSKFLTSPVKEEINKAPGEDKIKISALPGFLGGGAYNTIINQPEKLATSTRAYAGVQSEEGKDRHHIIPVEFGGSSEIDKNISKLDEKAHARITDAQFKISQDYKAGKLDLPEARLKMMTALQKELDAQKGVKQGVFDNLLGGIKETFSDIKEGAKKVQSFLNKATAPTQEELDQAKQSKTGSIITKTGNLLIVDKKTGKYSQIDATAGVGAMKDVAKEVLDDIAKTILKETKPKGLISKGVEAVKNIIPKVFTRAAESIAPIKHQNEAVKSSFKTWTRELLVGEEEANKQLSKVPQLADNFDTILKYEKGENTKYSETLKKEFDALFKKAGEKGVKLNYRENYVPQVYQNTAEEVKISMSRFMKDQGVQDELLQGYLAGIEELPDTISKRLKLNPFFSKERAFPNYQTAIKYGLTPKYTEPAQLIAHYDAELNKTVANRKFVDDLLAKGQIATVEKAGENWESLSLPFSPKGYYAPPELAKMLNGMFRNEELLGTTETIFKGASSLSRTMQEVVLSAGVPKTNINFFAIGQLVKNLTAGEFKSAASFVRSNFNKPSIEFLQSQGQYLEKMANQGIDILKRVDSYGNIYKTLKDTNGITKKVGLAWDKAFGEKTFKSFMPQMQVQTFKDIYSKALKKMSPEEAEKLAGDTVKAFYGLHENLGRGKGTEDALGAVFFAPKFREGIINTLFNTAKSVTTDITNPAFVKNRKLLAGMILSYAGYNALNKKLTGHYMWENPDGKEFDLMIPTKMGNTQDDVVYIGFMPSFLAFARNIGSGGIALAKGDTATAKQKLGSVFSMPIKLVSEMWANKDYFGRKIYEDYDDPKTKAKKLANYALLSVNHPFIKEFYNQLTTDKPLYQSISESMELPLKFSSYTKIEKQEFYDAIRKREAIEAKSKTDFKPRYTEIRNLLEEGKVEEATNSVNQLSPEEYNIYKSLKKSDKTRANVNKEIEVFGIYKQAQALLSEGKKAEAKDLIYKLDNEEYKAYQRLKAKLQ